MNYISSGWVVLKADGGGGREGGGREGGGDFSTGRDNGERYSDSTAQSLRIHREALVDRALFTKPFERITWKTRHLRAIRLS